MTELFGDRDTFAVEVGAPESRDLRAVDLWAAGTLLTGQDNCAYLPTLTHHMRGTAETVRRREVPPCPFPGRTPERIFGKLQRGRAEFRQRYWFGPWDEILDDTVDYAYLDTDLVLLFALWGPGRSSPGDVSVVRIPPDDFVAMTLAAVDFLETRPA